MDIRTMFNFMEIYPLVGSDPVLCERLLSEL
jgi:hypothetical protein